MNCSLELVCINLSLPFGKAILVACYRPPDSDSSFVDELYSVLLHLQSRYRRAKFVLCGDFNYPDIDWEELSAGSRQSKRFLDLILTFNLIQCVKTPTRGSSILDLVFVSEPELCQSLSCTSGLSDHHLLFFNLAIPIPTRRPSLKYIRDYNKADYEKINQALEEFLHQFRMSAHT